ncbi:DUF2177 family protein [Erysipelothrix sp. HDW6C]|uniref:DUF2177 family protein n=1 Tax=Erysipelothrix sp. HDW6C TaxID=2714930 RepID=UPI00140AA97D|nr:DUF2177 family protein [Erysipelothrix sp. HDW6C]QIK68778.1 DUF2177 family protein [Erysipelothrix sp. HDW6C]
MKKKIYIFSVTAVIFLVIDALWLISVGTSIYQQEIGSLLKDVTILPAVIFYVLYVVGMIVFVIDPNLHKYKMHKVLLMGFLFGVVCYGTYDLTNMATLKDWSWKIVVLDMIWGGFVTMLTTGIVTHVFKEADND